MVMPDNFLDRLSNLEKLPPSSRMSLGSPIKAEALSAYPTPKVNKKSHPKKGSASSPPTCLSPPINVGSPPSSPKGVRPPIKVAAPSPAPGDCPTTKVKQKAHPKKGGTKKGLGSKGIKAIEVSVEEASCAATSNLMGFRSFQFDDAGSLGLELEMVCQPRRGRKSDQMLMVHTVAADGPGEALGVQVGAQVVAINGREMAVQDLHDALAIAQRPLVIHMRDPPPEPLKAHGGRHMAASTPRLSSADADPPEVPKLSLAEPLMGWETSATSDGSRLPPSSERLPPSSERLPPSSERTWSDATRSPESSETCSTRGSGAERAWSDSLLSGVVVPKTGRCKLEISFVNHPRTDGVVLVSSLGPEGACAANGILVGHHISKINDIRFKDHQTAVWLADNADSKVVFTLASEMRQITLDHTRKNLGISIVDNVTAGVGVIVTCVQPSLAGALAGLEVGHAILAVNGKLAWRHEEVMSQMDGHIGLVELTIAAQKLSKSELRQHARPILPVDVVVA